MITVGSHFWKPRYILLAIVTLAINVGDTNRAAGFGIGGKLIGVILHSE